MTTSVGFVLAIIGVALVFDFINGFHDSANSIATVVSTRVLSPGVAVVWAASFNFIAAFVVGTAVAKTISKGLIQPSVVDPTRGPGRADRRHHLEPRHLVSRPAQFVEPRADRRLRRGGGREGRRRRAHRRRLDQADSLHLHLAAARHARWGSGSRWRSPGRFGTRAPARWTNSSGSCNWCRRPCTLLATGPTTPRRPWASWSGCSSPRQALFIDQTGLLHHLYLPNADSIPFWVEMAAYSAIALGTALGGWRIVKTMGSRITKLRPFGGFCAETSGAISLGIATSLGVPVSTTHTITGAIVGVGAANRLSAVRWGVAGRIVWAWVLTIPMSAAIAGLTYLAIR